MTTIGIVGAFLSGLGVWTLGLIELHNGNKRYDDHGSVLFWLLMVALASAALVVVGDQVERMVW